MDLFLAFILNIYCKKNALIKLSKVTDENIIGALWVHHEAEALETII